MSTHYTLSGLYNQRSKLKDMIIKLIATVQQADYTEGTTGSFTHVLDDTMFMWDIKYIRKPIKDDLSYMTVASASLKLGKNPFFINFDSGDFLGNDMPPEILDTLTDALISSLASHMARTWYTSSGMQERITNLAECKDFKAIEEHVESNLSLSYNDYSYAVTIYAPNGDMLIKDIHESTLKIRPDPSNTSFHQFLRYLDNGILLLLASREVWKDKWSAPLIKEIE